MVGCALCKANCDGIVHDLLDFLLEFLDFRFGKMLAVDQVVGEQLDVVRTDLRQFGRRRIPEFELPDRRGDRIPALIGLEFDRRPIGAGIGHGMAAITIGLAFDELRAAAAPDAIQRLRASRHRP